MSPTPERHHPMRGTAVAKTRAVPLPEEQGPRKNVFVIKGTPEWRAWLERLSKHCRMKASVVVDHALVDFAAKQGFDEPPPER